MEITQKQYDLMKAYKPIMQEIIRSASAVGLSIDYRENLNRVRRELGYNDCTSCSSSIFIATSQLYNLMLQYENANSKSNKTNKRKPKSKDDN